MDKTKLYGRDKKKTWQLVNQISNYKRKSSTTIKNLVDKHGNILANPSEIANSLNKHFCSIGKFMAKKFNDMDSTRLKDPNIV